MAKVTRYRGMTREQMAEATKAFETPGFVPTPSGKMRPKLKAAERRVRGEIRRRKRSA